MPSPVADPVEVKNELLLPVAEHWLKGRIEAPLAAVDRLDQNAKQMIALAGGLQVVLTAVIKLTPNIEPQMLRFAIASFSFLFLSVVLSALVLFQQQRVLATRWIIPVLSRADSAEITRILSDQVSALCQDVDGLIKWKKWFLTGALVSFSISMLGSIGCLFVMLP